MIVGDRSDGSIDLYYPYPFSRQTFPDKHRHSVTYELLLLKLRKDLL